MEEYTNLLKDYLVERRNFTKTMFKIVGTIFRAERKGRITYDEDLKAIERLGGAN